MPDIYHIFYVGSTPEKVFEMISLSEGLDKWWTRNSLSSPKLQGEYHLDFGPLYRWKAVVTKYQQDLVFELRITEADADWTGTKVGFILESIGNRTEVNFYHSGWQQANKHFKISSFCWAMYLRILKRHIETGEEVPYEKRLAV
jgi:hypothetical protein